MGQYLPDLTGLVWLAIIGLVALVGGAAWLIWFAIHHLSVFIR